MLISAHVGIVLYGCIEATNNWWYIFDFHLVQGVSCLDVDIFSDVEGHNPSHCSYLF